MHFDIWGTFKSSTIIKCFTRNKGLTIYKYNIGKTSCACQNTNTYPNTKISTPYIHEVIYENTYMHPIKRKVEFAFIWRILTDVIPGTADICRYIFLLPFFDFRNRKYLSGASFVGIIFVMWTRRRTFSAMTRSIWKK